MTNDTLKTLVYGALSYFLGEAGCVAADLVSLLS